MDVAIVLRVWDVPSPTLKSFLTSTYLLKLMFIDGCSFSFLPEYLLWRMVHFTGLNCYIWHNWSRPSMGVGHGAGPGKGKCSGLWETARGRSIKTSSTWTLLIQTPSTRLWERGSSCGTYWMSRECVCLGPIASSPKCMFPWVWNLIPNIPCAAWNWRVSSPPHYFKTVFLT